MKLFKSIKRRLVRFLAAKGRYIVETMPSLKNKLQGVNVFKCGVDYVRVSSLELVSREIIDKCVEGNVAELGVYKGDFARYINYFFPDRELFLFDTFEGFDSRDVKIEVNNNFSKGDQDFSDTNIEHVLSKMPYREKCHPIKGWFPQTAESLENKEFAFVSLDADLYAPIYEGLKWFYPRLAKGGVIFIHDYNNDGYSGVKCAVRQYCEENGIAFMPLPDIYGSVVILK